jgi:hypothetical protein
MKIIASFLILVMIFTNSHAQDSASHPTDQKIAPWYVDRFRLSVGGFVPITNTTLQVGIKGGDPGTPIDLQKDLDYNNGQLTFLASFQWRISRRSRLSLSYYNIPSNSTHKLEKDITFKDSVYHANSTLSSFFNTAIYQISYGYAIISKPRYELGVLIGTHTVGAKAGISVDAAGGSASRSSNFDFTAPLPDLGLWGGYTFSDRFAVNLDIDYLSLTIDNISGSIFAYNLLFIYRAMDKLDISLGYSGLNFDLDVVKNKYEGSFKWGYNGPALGVSYAFGKTTWKH